MTAPTVPAPKPSTGRGSRIAGVGSYQPARILDNEELSQIVDTTDEWIRSRVGIQTTATLPTRCLGSSRGYGVAT